MDKKRRPLRIDPNFQTIKSGLTKQIKKREAIDDEVTYVDSNRNIAVVLGEEDLKADLNEQGLAEVLPSEEGVQSCDLFHREAFYHFKKKNFIDALQCAEKAQDLTEETDLDVLTLQAELELQTGDYQSALKSAGTILVQRKNSWKAIYIRAECLYNMCEFEHALIMYHKGKKKLKKN